MRTESLGRSYLVLPDGPGPLPGVVVVHEASGLNDNIRDICGRFAAKVMPRSALICSRGVPHDLKVYPGAKHAFFDDQWRAYHPAAAADSWQRVLAFSPSMSGEARRGDPGAAARDRGAAPAGRAPAAGLG